MSTSSWKYASNDYEYQLKCEYDQQHIEKRPRRFSDLIIDVFGRTMCTGTEDGPVQRLSSTGTKKAGLSFIFIGLP